MLTDLRFGLKMLWKEKAFTFAALLTLGLCIGANTAIFTFLKAVVLEPLPLPDSGRLVTMYNVYPGMGITEGGANAVPDYLDRRQMTDVFDSVTLLGNRGYDVGGQGSTARVEGAYVTPSFFQVLRVYPTLGRTFNEEDAKTGNNTSVILSYGLWKEMFGQNPGVLGKEIRMSGVVHRIVGVMPESFAPVGSESRLWVPFAFTPRQMSDDGRHNNNWGMIARLKPGVTLDYAQRRLDGINRVNVDRMPRFRDLLIQARFGTRILFLKDELVKEARPLLYLLQAAVGFVLLIGCVNVANLLLVRSNVRMKELAVRYSLGADRWRLARQLLTESVTLAVAGGLAGVLIGLAGVRLLSALSHGQLPSGIAIRVDTGVLAFSAACAILTGLAFGLVPVFHVIRRDLNEVFRQGGRTGTTARGALWTRSALVVTQMALAFVLLAGSGLLTMSFARLLTVNPGFNPQNVLSARFSLPEVRYKDDARERAFVGSLLDGVRSVPGVTHVGATAYLPFSGDYNASVTFVEGHTLAPGELPPVPGWNSVDAGYLQTMGIPVLRGRGIEESDGPDAQKVVLIDEFMARKYWPKENPIGARIRRGPEKDDPICTIVGVVGNVKTGDLAEQNSVGQIYFSYKQFSQRTMHVVVKAARDDAQLTAAIRRELQKADPELALFDVKSMPQRLSSSVGNRRAAMVVCLAFAGLALLLAAVGIYGVLAYAVAQRTREFGIRSALGAGVRDVLTLVVGQGARLAAMGLVIGVAGALALMRLMSTMLFSVKPGDPMLYLIVASLLMSVALVAALIPSVRAARIQPAAALRAE